MSNLKVVIWVPFYPPGKQKKKKKNLLLFLRQLFVPNPKDLVYKTLVKFSKKT